VADDRRGEDWKTGDAREYVPIGGTGCLVKDVDTGDEIRSIGQIEIIHPVVDARFDDAVPVIAIGLKRSTRIHQDVGLKRCELRNDIAIAIERYRNEMRFCFASRVAKPAGFFERPPGNCQDQAGFIFQQLNDAAAECAISADDEDVEAVGHTTGAITIPPAPAAPSPT